MTKKIQPNLFSTVPYQPLTDNLKEWSRFIAKRNKFISDLSKTINNTGTHDTDCIASGTIQTSDKLFD